MGEDEQEVLEEETSEPPGKSAIASRVMHTFNSHCSNP